MCYNNLQVREVEERKQYYEKDNDGDDILFLFFISG